MTPYESPDMLRQRVDALTRLVQVSLVLNSTQALDPLLRFIMDSASALVDAEAASILLLDKDTRDLVFAASSSAGSQGLIGQPVPQEGSIAGQVLRENRPLAINDARRDPRHYRGVDQLTQFETRSVLGVPMLIKERPIGVLEAVNKRSGSWTVQDRTTLTILAAQAAVAIENARLVSALQRANQDLSRLDALKSQFIAVASHELRTPLGIILGYASFLKEEAQGAASAHAEAVFRGALQLRAVIEQLTNLGYLKEHGRVELARAWTPLAGLLHTAVQDITSLAEAKRHRLSVSLPPDAPDVYVDAARMQSALSNVLNNAVKFTPEDGTIALRAEVRAGEVWISVSDSGIGFPPEEREKIFEEFYQVEDHLTRHYGGIGLGLAIARALVEAHGGRIWAESAGPGRGATFTLSLPLDADLPPLG